MRAKDSEWDSCVHVVLYGYRHRGGNDKRSPYEVLYGVHLKLPTKRSKEIKRRRDTSAGRGFEHALAYTARAERVVSRSINDLLPGYQVGDKIILVLGKESTGLKIDRRFCSGPCTIKAANHPHYILKNAPQQLNSKICTRSPPSFVKDLTFEALGMQQLQSPP